MRRKIVAGNWKMNLTPSEAKKLIEAFRPQIDSDEVDVVLCVPAIDIVPVVQALEGSTAKIGAENMYYEERGAYTGEISAEMLTDAGVSYVILGHSERRQYFGETDQLVNKKARKAIEAGLTPIICCGETIEQREEGITLRFIQEQIKSAFSQIPSEDAKKCVVAYEPIWAIGTGHVATTKQAQEVCAAIRKNLEELYGAEVSEAIRILYGGSVNVANAAELFEQPDIDGGLVGGASMKPDFTQIVHFH